MLLRTAVVLLTLSTALFAQEDAFVIPVTASSPHVLLGITDERNPDEVIFNSEISERIGGNSLPLDESPHYEIAVYDTGAPATIFGSRQANEFGLLSGGFGGTEVLGIGGVGEPVDAVSSDPVGVYAAGFDALLTNPNNPSQQVVDTQQLRGSITNSVIYGAAGVELPSLVGTTTATYYTTLINYSDPRILDYEGETYRSPNTSLVEKGSVPRPAKRIQMEIVNGAAPPTLVINFGGGFDDRDLRNNPSIPTTGPSYWVTANVTNNGSTRNQLEAIFDTGAQGSFVSEQIAAEMGFDVELDDPDFVVRLAGVTGVSEEVPGFYADEFVLPGTGGGLVLKNVPLVVFNITDPRDGVNTLDSLIGMNLFAYHDVVLNPEAGNSYLGFSQEAVQRHRWTTTKPTASFNVAESWLENANDLPATPSIDWYTQVSNVTGSHQLSIVEQDSEVSYLVTGGMLDNAEGTIDVSVQTGKTLTVFGSAIIQDGSTVTLNDSTLDAQAVEVRGGGLVGSGKILGEVLIQGDLIPGNKDRIGTIEFPGSMDLLSQGVMQVELGYNSKTGVQNDKIEVGGAVSIDGTLEITTLDEYTQPAGGTQDNFVLIESELGINVCASSEDCRFDEYFFNGIQLEEEFVVFGDRRNFRDHVGAGQFLEFNYSTATLEMINFQASPGDTDGDGQVLFEDFLRLASTFGGEADWTGGDFTGDGLVSFEDFLLLNEYYGGALPAQNVPEPATASLAIFGLLLLCRRNRR